MPTVYPDHLLPATDYGFPAEELASIRTDYPEVDVRWNAGTREYGVFARGRSGEIHAIIGLERSDFFRLHQMLHDMRYRALNRPLSSIAEWGQAIRDKEEADSWATVDAGDPDHAARDLRVAKGWRGDQVSMAGGSAAEV
jgi:hypothetical protein